MMFCRKPDIYLLPPEPLPEATVSLRLIPQWSFRHIYPASQPKPQDGGGQSITWNVSASPDGWLVEKGSNLELWEAANSGTDRERTRAVPSTLTPLTLRSLPARPPPCSSPSRISSRTSTMCSRGSHCKRPHGTTSSRTGCLPCRSSRTSRCASSRKACMLCAGG
ncbi:hypothetical protein BD309DRAFT_1040645 [Dichomitus squalens]|nr:hypothetical protein BD309DRAFT_1040645 [Dichomitus squalens]